MINLKNAYEIRNILNNKVIDKIEDELGKIWYEAFRILPASGVPPITLQKCKKANLVDYKIYGNSKQESENLLDISTTTLTNNTYIDNTGVEVSNNFWKLTDYIEVNTYSLTLENITGNTPAICAYDENKDFITGVKYSNKTSVILSSTTLIKYVRVSVSTSWVLNDVFLFNSPTPEHPIKVESLGNVTKNLVDFSLNSLELLKYSNSASNNTRYGVDMGILPAGGYTISFDLVDENDIPLYIYIRRRSSIDGTWGSVVSMTTEKLQTTVSTFNTDGTYNYYMFVASNAFNTLATASEQWKKMKNIQLEYGTEKTNCVPHIEIPIKITPTIYEFSLDNIAKQTYGTGTSRYGFDLGVLEEGKYTFDFEYDTRPTYVGFVRDINGKETAEYITTNSTGRDETPFTFTADGITHFYIIFVSTTIKNLEQAQELWKKVKVAYLQKGNEIQSTITNIYLNTPLRKINEHADYIDFKNKKIIRPITRYKIRNMGFALLSSGASYRFETTANTTIQNIKLFTEQDSKNLICESLTTTDYSDNSNETISERTNLNYIKIRTAKYATLTELYDGIGDSNVYFVLKTPKEEEIELPDILLNKGTNIIEVDANMLPSNMEVEYYGKE